MRTIRDANSRVDICKICGKYLEVFEIERGICGRCIQIRQIKRDDERRLRESTKRLGINVGLVAVLKRRIVAALRRSDDFIRSRRIGQANITLQYLLSLYDSQKGLCALSGRKLSLGAVRVNEYDPNVISVDRKDPNKGYTVDNVQLVTWQVNAAKGRSTNEEFLALCRDVVTKSQGNMT